MIAKQMTPIPFDNVPCMHSSFWLEGYFQLLKLVAIARDGSGIND